MTSVLNARLGERGLRVRSGQFLEGYVLGSTKIQIPERYIHGSLLEGQFSVLDWIGREFRGEVQLVVDRHAQVIRRGRSARPGEGLYAPNELPSQSDSAEEAPIPGVPGNRPAADMNSTIGTTDESQLISSD